MLVILYIMPWVIDCFFMKQLTTKKPGVTEVIATFKMKKYKT